MIGKKGAEIEKGMFDELEITAYHITKKQVIEEMGQIRNTEGHCVRCTMWHEDGPYSTTMEMYAVWWEGQLVYEGLDEDVAEDEWRRLVEMESAREICKNCLYCSSSYKGGVCRRGTKEKKVSYKGTCPEFVPKRK